MTTSPLVDAPAGLTPRVNSYPAYVSSAGDEAIELAAAAGLRLDPWQQEILRHALGERADGSWAAFEIALIVSRQNGKGALLEARELAGLFLLEEKLILHSAHEMKTATEAFRRIRDLVDNTDDLRRRVARVTLQRGDEGIELKGGARLRFVARSNGSGRGFSGDCVIMDEAYALTDGQMEAMLPTMSARPNPQIWYTSSPPLDPITGAQLFRVRDRGLKGADRLAYFDFGLDGTLDQLDGIDLDDPAAWRASNPAFGIRVMEEFVRSERATMSDVGFARERLGVWPSKPSQLGFRVIAEQFWNAARDPDRTIDGRPALGVYVPPDRSYSAIVAAGPCDDGKRLIELTGNDELGNDYRPGTAWIVPRLKQLEQHQPSVIVIDDKAVADEAEQAGLEVHRAVVADVVTGCQIFFDGIAGADPDGRDIRHLGQKEMTDAAAGAVKRKVGNSWAWERHDLTSDIGPVAAASLALFGHGTPRIHRRKAVAPFAMFG